MKLKGIFQINLTRAIIVLGAFVEKMKKEGKETKVNLMVLKTNFQLQFNLSPTLNHQTQFSYIENC